MFRNKFRLASAVTLFILSIASCANLRDRQSPSNRVKQIVNSSIDSLTRWLDEEFIPLLPERDSVAIRNSFYKGRRLYKTQEFAIEYFFGNAARSLNGPPLPEIEAEEHIILEPGGFQVLETFLFPFDSSRNADIQREARRMKSLLVRVKTLWNSSAVRDDQIFDAVRMELFRIITLGISGFDTPLCLKGVQEVPISLSALRTVIELYAQGDPVLTLIDSAILRASAEIDYNNFDRLEFITGHINPITTRLLHLQRELRIPTIDNVYAIRGNVATLFDTAAFNINYFVPDANSYATNERVSLGKKLFYDPVLSGNGKVSCSSCHNPRKAFTDGLQKSRAFSPLGFLDRNTPSLLNAAFQKAQFYDMRATFLEDQAKNVIENQDEVHGDMGKAAIALSGDTIYRAMFRNAFSEVKDSVSERSILVALACYVRSLTSMNARFDRYMRGDHRMMNDEEKKGFNLFMGKAKCGICHFMPLFNGTVPPAFTLTESEVIGVPATARGEALDKDPGRFRIHEVEPFRNAFKTPTVRNSSLTAPYMHNGAFRTMDQVIDFYNRGGGANLGYEVFNQTLPFDSLMLSGSEQKAIISFMGTLTDTSVIANENN